jgi:hypothetical protein
MLDSLLPARLIPPFDAFEIPGDSMSAFLILFIYFFHVTSTGNCERFPEIDFRKSGSPAFHGVYANHAFGYRVRLPRKITAYGEPSLQPAHGVGIILSWEPRSNLYLDGSWNALLRTRGLGTMVSLT